VPLFVIQPEQSLLRCGWDDLVVFGTIMSASGGKAGSVPLQQQKNGTQPDQAAASDLAFLDNIEDLNTNWPDYQVREFERGPFLGSSSRCAQHVMATAVHAVSPAGPPQLVSCLTGVPKCN
jgi:hypothetical protein